MKTDNFEDLRTKAERARKEAKSIRKKWKDGAPSKEREDAFETSIMALDEVINELEKWSGEQSAFVNEAKREMGDCFGVIGGTYRDWGKYREAAEAYEKGLPFEEELNRAGGQPNSYCLVQRLVSTVLADPAVLGSDDMRKKLEASLAIVRDQMKVHRSKDPWAQADVALLLQLLGDRAGNDAAVIAWDEFEDMRPERFVYESNVEVVKLIKEKLDPFLSDESKYSWEDLLSRLSPHS